MRNIQTAISPHPLKIGHMFICNYLRRILHTKKTLKYLLFLLKHTVCTYFRMYSSFQLFKKFVYLSQFFNHQVDFQKHSAQPYTKYIKYYLM